jgi:hypothetical protein
MNPHISAAMAAEHRCDLQEFAARRRAELGARRRRGLRERMRSARGLRQATARKR